MATRRPDDAVGARGAAYGPPAPPDRARIDALFDETLDRGDD